VLCPVSRPMTILDFVLLKDNNRAPVAKSGPQINSRVCLCVQQGPRHNARCCFPSSVSSFSLYSAYRPRERLRSNKPLNRTVPCELVGDFISSHSGMSRDPIQPHSVSDRDIIQRLLALSSQRRRHFGSPVFNKT